MCVCVCIRILYCTCVFLCVSWCFAFVSLHLVKGLYQKKSWLELSTETGLRVKTGSEILHTPDSGARQHTAAYIPLSSWRQSGGGGGLEHVALSGCGGAGGRIRTASHIKLLAGQRSSEEACVTE